jgi:hypothetical protein
MFRCARAVVLAAALLVVVPDPAAACPVCGLAGTQDNWREYVWMSVMLSALPLGMAIAGFVVIRRVNRRSSR